jgi:peptidyl-prolyl cis-trans isomerase B (cyclophilin B)
VPTEKQRREAARRHLERQLQRRQEREARRKRVTLIASVVGTLLIIGVVIGLVVGLSGGSGKSSAATQPSTTPSATSATPTPSAASSSAAAAAPSYPCTWTKGGSAARKVSVPATTKPPKSGTVNVNVSTTQGNLVLTLNRKAAPCTVASFVSLVQQKYYDNTPCHRLTTAGIYVLQCGDPTGTGTGGPGYTIPDEFHSTDKFSPGVLAMANTGAAHSGGGQFFIVYKASQLPPKYTIFGTVTAGMPVVDKVAAKGANPAGDGKPKLPITLKTLTVR